MDKSKSSVGLSIAIFLVAILAGYVVFAVYQKTETATATATTTTGDNGSATTVDGEGKRYDVVFTIDATGSMADEIEEVKSQVVNMSKELAAGDPAPEIRFGLVLYKDVDDDFLVKSTPLTYDAQTIRQKLRDISVDGGGDHPEHVGAALHEMLSLNWDDSQDVERIAYLVGDAPGHRDYQDGKDIDPAVAQAKQKGITIRALGCSGIDNDGGKIQFTKIAKATGGTYKDLTYHAVVQGDDGKKRSVIYEGGEAYEADEVLPEEEWSAGAGALKKKGKLKPARPAMKRKADSAEKKNNAIEIIRGDF